MPKKEITGAIKMPFGKWKGQPIANVPAKTLLYYHDNMELFGDVKTYIDEYYDIIVEQAKNDEKGIK